MRHLLTIIICFGFILAPLNRALASELSAEVVQLIHEANMGNPEAMFRLALKYARGEGGLPIDMQKADEWMELAETSPAYDNQMISRMFTAWQWSAQ